MDFALEEETTMSIRKATPEETKALFGKGYVMPVPRPQKSPEKDSAQPASKPKPQADAEPQSQEREQGQ